MSRELLNSVVFEAGNALYDCQVFEFNFKYLVVLLSRVKLLDMDPDDAGLILEGKAAMTVGQIFKLLRRQNISFIKDAEEKLNDALNARNEVVHHLFTKNIDRIATAETRQQVINEIKEFKNKIYRGNETLHPLLDQLTLATTGMRWEDSEKQIREKFDF